MLRGGIGNQLLQLAAYRALAARSGRQLILDVNSYSHPTQRLLGRLPEAVDAGMFSEMKVTSYQSPLMSRTASALHTAVRLFSDVVTPNRIPAGIYASEKGKDALDALRDRMHFRYLDAYFGYFAEVKDIAASIDSLVAELSRSTIELKSSEELPNASVCVHMRLGDFLEVDANRILSANEVERGLELLGVEGGSQILLFSDSPELAEKILKPLNLSIQHAPTGISDLQSLLLMASAEKLVCSRSTFSWWAGRIVSQSGGSVVYPTLQNEPREQLPNVRGWHWI